MDSGRIRVCGVAELPLEGGVKEFSVGKNSFCVARVNGEICVVDNECPHHGGPLGEGVVEDGKVVCPWHAYGFDLKTGACEQEARLVVKVYQAEAEGGELLVTL